MKTSSLIHALAIFLLLTAAASADPLISFLGQPNNGAYPITQSSMVASDFRTGSVSTTVSQITVSARQSGPSAPESSMLDVLIIADNNGRPGDFLNTPSYYVGGFGGTMAVPANTTTFAQFTRSATSGIVLAPNTTYWLVFYLYSGPGLDIDLTASQNADPGGVYSPVASTAMKWGSIFFNWTDVPGAHTPLYRLQGNPTNAPEITVEQPAGSGLIDNAGLLDFGGLLVGQDVTRVFTVRNTGMATLSGIAVTLDGAHAGTDFQMTAAPAASLAAGASTTFSITFSPDALGTRTAAIHIASNDADENPFDIAITGQGLTASQSWRQTWFGSTGNTGDAAPNADPNNNGIPNLMEYALGGDPTGSSTGTGVLPDVGINTAEHCMEFSLTRYLDRTDITLTVQAADSLSGPWTDLARSINGAAFTVLAAGATVTETGSGSTRTVTVCDIYQTTDPAHPRRFMHLVVSQ